MTANFLPVLLDFQDFMAKYVYPIADKEAKVFFEKFNAEGRVALENFLNKLSFEMRMFLKDLYLILNANGISGNGLLNIVKFIFIGRFLLSTEVRLLIIEDRQEHQYFPEAGTYLKVKIQHKSCKA